MKKSIRKLLAAVTITALVASVTATSMVSVGAIPQYTKSDIISAFQNPDLDDKPMARMWFVDGQAGAIENDIIAEHLAGMARSGFGGVEIALLSDNSNTTNDQAGEYGWGTENWKKQ